jgi:hypothetical protein
MITRLARTLLLIAAIAYLGSCSPVTEGGGDGETCVFDESNWDECNWAE